MFLFRVLIAIALGLCFTEQTEEVKCGINCTEIGRCSCALATLKIKNNDYLNSINVSYLEANESIVVNAYHTELLQPEIDKLQEVYMESCDMSRDNRVSHQANNARQVVQMVDQLARSQMDQLEWYELELKLVWMRLGYHATSLNQTLARLDNELSHSHQSSCARDNHYDQLKHIVQHLQLSFNLTYHNLTTKLNTIDSVVHSFIRSGTLYEKEIILNELTQLGENGRQFESRLQLFFTTETLKADVTQIQFPLDLYTEINFLLKFSASLKPFVKLFVQDLNKVHVSG